MSLQVGSVVAAEGGASELQNRGGGAGKGVVEKQGKLHVTETQSFAGQQITVRFIWFASPN